MRKAILTVLMMLVLVIPAYAAEGEAATDHPIQQEQEPVVVSTLEELQAAIDAAEDGDTIAISSKIEIRENCFVGVEDKVITNKNTTAGIERYFRNNRYKPQNKHILPICGSNQNHYNTEHSISNRGDNRK